MALQLSSVGGYGTGALGNVANQIYGSAINSYAHVTAINGAVVTIDGATKISGQYEKFTLGAEVLFHVSSANSTSAAYLGKYLVATITNVDVTGNVLTLSQDVTEILPAEEFANYNCQLITSANFANLTLDENINITPPAYSASFTGGISFIKCTGTLTLNGGHINLADKGISVGSASLRPLTAQESGGLADTDTYSAWENSQTQHQFVLNAGDGAALIVAREIAVGDDASRIGNFEATGEQFIRGNGSNNLEGGTPRQGGSTLFIVADTLTDFVPAIISKNRTGAAGAGLGRCYIASNTRLRNDEGLYAYDIISDPTRLMRVFNVKNFGDGSLGDATDVTAQINNYALVTAISADRKTLTYSGKTTAGIAPITVGALVMVHFNHKSNTSGVADSGRFTVAKVVNDTGTEITLDAAVHDINLDDCYCQIVSIPQYRNFTLATANSATPVWDYTTKKGGIFAIAVNGICDLRGGHVDVQEKGTSVVANNMDYGRPGLAYIGNAQMHDRLPIGSGHGSVFLLANEIIMDESTRIGAYYSGARTGGEDNSGVKGGYFGLGRDAGSGAYGGNCPDRYRGGYGSNGVFQNNTRIRNEIGFQGAHVLIVAGAIQNFNQAAISTGGSCRQVSYNAEPSSTYEQRNGGAGYGGASGSNGLKGGGYNGGGAYDYHTGGGSSGWAFVYCNHAINQDTTMTVLLG